MKKNIFSHIVPRVKKAKDQLDSFALITSKPWVLLDEDINRKDVYFFRSKKELLISSNGKIQKCRWEYLGHNNLIIENKNESILLKNAFFEETILGLKIDGKDDYMLLVDQKLYEDNNGSLKNIIAFINETTNFTLYID